LLSNDAVQIEARNNMTCSDHDGKRKAQLVSFE